MKWEKIFSNHKSNKELIPKIYEEEYTLNGKKSNNSIKIFQTHAKGKQVHKKVLNVTRHQRSANQSHKRYHLTPFTMSIMKNVRKDMEQRKSIFIILCKQCKLVQPLSQIL